MPISLTPTINLAPPPGTPLSLHRVRPSLFGRAMVDDNGHVGGESGLEVGALTDRAAP